MWKNTKLSKQLTGPKKTAGNPNKIIFIRIVYSTNLHKLKYVSLGNQALDFWDPPPVV